MLSDDDVTEGGDDDGSDDIEGEAFTGHGFDVEVVGAAEDDGVGWCGDGEHEGARGGHGGGGHEEEWVDIHLFGGSGDNGEEDGGGGSVGGDFGEEGDDEADDEDEEDGGDIGENGKGVADGV